MSDCCRRCARRSWLVGRLAGHIEKARADRVAVRTLLALPSARLIAAVGGALAGPVTEEMAGLDLDAVLAGWGETGARTVCRHSREYPPRLAVLPDPPAALHVVGPPGRLPELAGAPAVALVGARRCSPGGARIAAGLGRGCSAAGVTVVSGMALGVDAAAHRGALESAGATVAVLAGGPERAYPARWRRLHAEIASRGAVVSELPPGTPSFRWGFPARNRIIAALSGLVVVVEAAARSGSLITAEIAADLGVTVGAVPGAPGSPLAEAPNELIRDGAVLVRDAADVLEELVGVRPRGAPATEIEPELAEVAELVAAGVGSTEEIALRVGHGAAVLSSLTRLELLGVVERLGPGRYAPGAAPWRVAGR